MTFPVPGGAVFLRARENLADVASPAAALANLGGLGVQAVTGLEGFALADVTSDIISWDVPDDGQLHVFLVFAQMDVTEATTGGNVSTSFTQPDGSGVTSATLTGTQDFTGYNFSFFGPPAFCKPGSTVTVSQSSALSAGAGTVWAAIWGL